ncbi:PelD GGDEF domain-containing protein [Ottowia sp.]|uniref:PelD GGDEF domain-containing protein n=1 Tax=Ottowia sp. TaxID=1898956 RepID=UPI002C455607|nr:PelD GGDEF domain-containing protein [Ottowia sp.]
MVTSAQTVSTPRQIDGDGVPSGTGVGLHPPPHLLGKLTAPASHPVAMVAEIIALPLLAVALGYIWAPQDPLQVNGEFPWAWLAPLLLALRYGPLAGLGAAGVLLVAWWTLNPGRIGLFPQMYFLGGLILVFVAGEFSSFWRTRTRRAEAVQLYLDQRLDHVVRQHYLLRLSHDRLGRELIGRPMSMHDALVALRDTERDDVGSKQGAQALLRLLAQFCQLDCAALHSVAHGQIAADPAAVLGVYQGMNLADPLVRQALETRKLCHISQAVAAQQDSQYLVAAPLLDLAGEMYGLLLVQNMSFFALHTENLQTLQLLLGYYTDGLSMNALAQPIVQRVPDCPYRFAFEVQRLAHLKTSADVSSIVVALELTSTARSQDLMQQILRLRRELDETWLIETPARQVLAVLMPLGDGASAEGYIARLEDWLQQKSNQSLAEAGVFSHVLPLDGTDPAQTVERIHALAYAA